MKTRTIHIMAALGLMGSLVPACRADLIKPVETIGSAGVVRVGTYSEDDMAYFILGSTTFSFYGTNYSGLTVSTNGTLTYGNTNYFTSNPTNLPMPRGSTPGLWVCQDNWTQPDSAATPRGYIYYKSYPGEGLAVTWVNLRQSPVTLGPLTNTFQIFLYDNGNIAFGYDQLNRVVNYVVGINKGSGGIYSSLTGANTGTTAFTETGVPSINLRTYLFRYNGTDYVASRLLPRTVSGKLTRESLVPTAAAQPATFFFHANDGSPDFSRTIDIPASGNFALTDIPPKTYQVRIKSPKWLAIQRALDLAVDDAPQWNNTLPGGDVDDDNAVDIADLLLLIQHYNTLQNSGSGYLGAADINGDGAVDITDLLVVIGNYNKIGE